MNAIALTRDLVTFNTINPPGDEAACAQFLGRLLEDAGFTVRTYAFAPGRTSLIATLTGAAGVLPLCFTGHIDVVPLGAAPWSRQPFAGERDGDRLFGRGTSDMKAGIAAFVVAAIALANDTQRRAPLTLVITAGEETGCEGARDLVSRGVIGEAGAMVVAEPTSNYPYIGHKGLCWIEVETEGITAHGSMPDQGDNALLKLAPIAAQLGHFRFDVDHPVMGQPTLNVATFHAGLNTNSVPDRARMTLDVRSVPGQDHTHICATLRCFANHGNARFSVFNDVPSVYTEPEHAWVQSVFDATEPLLGARPTPRTITFSTDAAFLKPGFRDCPTVILGPGEPSVAHQTDEWVSCERIDASVEVFRDIMQRWGHSSA
jgi:succinyl-diaminopimelate desuccinylase